jgi:hypothetical protein
LFLKEVKFTDDGPESAAVFVGRRVFFDASLYGQKQKRPYPDPYPDPISEEASDPIPLKDDPISLLKPL